MKAFRRIPSPTPDARARALARLAARPHPRAHLHTQPPTHPEERDEVRGGWTPTQQIPHTPRPDHLGADDPRTAYRRADHTDPEDVRADYPSADDPPAAYRRAEHPGLKDARTYDPRADQARTDQADDDPVGQPRLDRLRDARWTLTPRHVAVLAVVLLLGLTWVAWTFLRARPEPVPDTRPTTATAGSPVAQPNPTQQQPTPTQPGASQSPQTPGAMPTQPPVVVHVAGKVRRPGLIKAPPGSRVADVLTLAGGPLRGVDLTSLNLARQVTDGEQIIVGQPAPTNPPPSPTPPDPTTAPNNAVNLNTATLAELDALPGVGPVLAQRILDYRTQNGPFTTVDQLQEVPGVGPKKFDSLRPHVRT
ncbi:ComEA family DNA-binding protein [Kribbella sp. NPDC051936]|uniref:ComEA family DNA-binding protein n=1 Tax=Kribbella sp. NPDC051936 TaxID=3154946 RepID=UPI0034121726